MESATATRVWDPARWTARLNELAPTYRSAKPFPYIALDGFLEEEPAREAWKAFPKVEDAGWIHYVHVNEKKHGLNKLDRIPGKLREVIQEMNSPEFVSWLEKLTGIEGLKADEMLEGGGLHQSGRGGYLNIHADFTVHPHKRHWKRRVNLLLYFNPDWQEEWGGHLELWERDMSACVQRVLPVFGRCVIFNTDGDSYHGLPEPIMCPEGRSRKSVALYYFTEEENAPALRTTNYRARPKDGIKGIAIWLDKKAIYAYTRIKRAFGLNDDFASRVLGIFSGKGKR